MGTRDGTLLMRYPLPATPPSCVPPPSVPTLHAIVTLLSRNAFTFGIAPCVLTDCACACGCGVVVCMQVKLVRMLDFDPRLSLVSRTVSAAWSELAFFMLSCGLIVFGYGLAGSIIFGEEHAEFWDPPSAIGAYCTVGYIYIYI
jgi:hypothetical protein